MPGQRAGVKGHPILLLLKQGNRELKRLVHPNAALQLSWGTLPERILKPSGDFLSPTRWYLSSVCWLLSLPVTGVDDFSAFSPR